MIVAGGSKAGRKHFCSTFLEPAFKGQQISILKKQNPWITLYICSFNLSRIIIIQSSALSIQLFVREFLHNTCMIKRGKIKYLFLTSSWSGKYAKDVLQSINPRSKPILGFGRILFWQGNVYPLKTWYTADYQILWWEKKFVSNFLKSQ